MPVFDQHIFFPTITLNWHADNAGIDSGCKKSTNAPQNFTGYLEDIYGSFTMYSSFATTQFKVRMKFVST